MSLEINTPVSTFSATNVANVQLLSQFLFDIYELHHDIDNCATLLISYKSVQNCAQTF